MRTLQLDAQHRPLPWTSNSNDRFYLHGDAAAPLQFIAWGEGDAGGNSGRRAGLQAIAGTNELWQGLQGVNPQLNELTLECERAQRSAGSLQGEINQITVQKDYSWIVAQFCAEKVLGVLIY